MDYFLGKKTTKDNLFNTIRMTSIWNLYTYKILKNNSLLVIQMASWYTDLAIKMRNSEDNMPSLSHDTPKQNINPIDFFTPS